MCDRWNCCGSMFFNFQVISESRLALPGCAHGATKEWWTSGRECGSMVNCYGVDSVDL